jgi:hypothetical protein
MLGFFSRLLFTTTAIAPVALVYAYALWIDQKPSTAVAVAVAALALVGIALLFISAAFEKLATSKIELTSAETADQENVAFLLLYVSPLFTADVAALNFSIALPVVALFVLVVMSGNNYHFNPLLNIFGWHFYKVDTPDKVTRVLITRRSIRNVIGELSIVQLSDYVIMEVPKRRRHG